jgi:hypothetical protein
MYQLFYKPILIFMQKTQFQIGLKKKRDSGCCWPAAADLALDQKS